MEFQFHSTAPPARTKQLRARRPAPSSAKPEASSVDVPAPRSHRAPPPAARSMAAANSSRALLPVLALTGVVFFLLAPAAAAAAADAVAPQGLEFHVGGPRGWRVPDANTSYGWWAMNNRFRVGDHLYFKYANDSVLLVDRTAFDACNTTEPLATFADGATRFVLDRPGFFCFISGEPGHCEQGQRLIVRVMVHPAIVTTPGPASAPATFGQPGHGGGQGHPPVASFGAATAVVASAAGVAVAAALAVIVSLVLMLH